MKKDAESQEPQNRALVVDMVRNHAVPPHRGVMGAVVPGLEGGGINRKLLLYDQCWCGRRVRGMVSVPPECSYLQQLPPAATPSVLALSAGPSVTSVPQNTRKMPAKHQVCGPGWKYIPRVIRQTPWRP